VVRYDEFEQRATDEWERIPASYKGGVDGLIVKRSARAHPTLDGVYTLGECLTEAYPSAFGGPDTIRSAVVLYYGSFLRLAQLDEEFDWERELWDTLTHELQHHLESLAADEGLLDLDYAMDENFKRAAGEPFDTMFYRMGAPRGDGWYEVEDEFFFEAGEESRRIVFEWDGVEYFIEADPSDADALYLRVAAGLAEPPRELFVVQRRRTGMVDAVRALFGRRRATYEERDVEAQRLESD
jgi:hypothetical protein